jgi:hypothetical protein
MSIWSIISLVVLAVVVPVCSFIFGVVAGGGALQEDGTILIGGIIFGLSITLANLVWILQ